MLICSETFDFMSCICCWSWVTGRPAIVTSSSSCRRFHHCYQAMGSEVTSSDGISNELSRESPNTAQVIAEANTYEDIVGDSIPASGNPVDYSQPELLIRT